MLKTRIAVFVSGGGTNLQALIDAQAAGIISSGEIALVVASRADAYALERAKNAGIPAAVASKKELGSQQAVEARLNQLLAEHDIDMIVLAGYLSILSADFTKRWDKRIINVHPSLIPAFCGEGMYGLKVHEAALNYGVKVSGATVHYVNEIADGGEIILQKAVRVCKTDTPQKLQKRIMKQAEWKILPAAAELVAARLAAEKAVKAAEPQLKAKYKLQ